MLIDILHPIVGKPLLGDRRAPERVRASHLLSAVARLGLGDRLGMVLDAGCGEGVIALTLARRYPNSFVIGCDIDEEDLYRAEMQRHRLNIQNVTFVQQNLSQPMDNGRYDLLYSLDVMEHIQDDEKVISNFWFALRNGGTLILHVPLRERRVIFKGRQYPAIPDHVRDGYEEPDLTAKLQRRGFIISQKRYTYGTVGQLAWEVYKNIEGWPKVLQLSLHPLIAALVFLDCHLKNRRGNGILVEAQKRGEAQGKSVN